MSVVSNALGGLVKLLSGAGYNAGQVGGFYNDALAKLLSSTGSPAAQQFGAEEAASLQPLFNKQDQGLMAKEAAMGITNSGAAKADLSDLKGQQAATLAGAIAPLYQTAIGEYGNIAGQGAGAQTGAYGQSLQDFYSMMQSAATGLPSGSGGPGAYSPSAGGAANPYAVTMPGGGAPIYETPYGDYTLTSGSPDSNPYAGYT